MRKILYILLLVGLFFVASLMNVSALNSTLTFAEFRYINNNDVEDKFTTWKWLATNDNSSDVYDLVGDGYHAVFTATINNNINHYVFPTVYNIKYTLNDTTFSCTNSSVINFTLNAFALDKNGNMSQDFVNEDFWKNVEVFLTTNNQHDESYRCTTVKSSLGDLLVSCPVSSSSYNNLHIHLNSEPFKNLSWSDENAHDFTYYISIDKSVSYECYDHPFLQVSSSVSGSSATVNVSSTEDDVTGYYFQLLDIDDEEHLSFENTYTWTGLSNGVYKGYVIAAYADGTRGTLTEFSFEVTDSPLPQANFTMSKRQNDPDSPPALGIDASTSVSESPITNYYYRLDDGQWYSSTSPYFVFTDVSYGNHKVSVMVENASGRSSLVSKTINVLTPYEEEKNFWEYIQSFFGDFWDNMTGFLDEAFDSAQERFNIWCMNFLNGTLRLFIPSEDYLNLFFTRMDNLIEEQFGFLSYPLTWTLNFLERFTELEDTGHYIISWGDIKVPNFDQNLINAGSYDLASLLENQNIKTAHDIYIMALNAIILLMFLNTCWNKANEIFGGSVVEYNTEVISDSYTTSNKGYTHSESTKYYKRRRKI